MMTIYNNDGHILNFITTNKYQIYTHLKCPKTDIDKDDGCSGFEILYFIQKKNPIAIIIEIFVCLFVCHLKYKLFVF